MLIDYKEKEMESLIVFFMSAVPIIEQRGAIPYGIFIANMDPSLVFLISFLGSLLPVPFILLLFNYIFKWMKKYKFFDPLNNIIENKIRKNTGKMEKYKELGLITFIAIPLPTTGLWTGSAIAAFLGLDFKKSFLCAALGGIISAALITLGCIIFPSMF
ncbi:COG2426 family protein [Clostridium mobile]|nr:small multi-drug export protein [Clostridium mobile]